MTRGKLSKHGRRFGLLLETVLKAFEAVALEQLASLPPSMKLTCHFVASESGSVVSGSWMLIETLKLGNKFLVDGADRLEALGLLEIVERASGQKPRIVRALYPKSPTKKSS